MGQSASQAAAFYRQVAAQGYLFTARDDQGYPAHLKSDGRRAQPFWSSESRIRRLAKACPAYQAFRSEKITWSAFVQDVAPDLSESGLLVGLNWSGANAVGYDLEPEHVIANVNWYRENSVTPEEGTT